MAASQSSLRLICRRLLPAATPLRIVTGPVRHTTPFSTIPHLRSPTKFQKDSKQLQDFNITSKPSYGVAGAPKPPKKDEVKFLPFVFIFAAGSGGYYLIVNQRAGQSQITQKMPALPSPQKTGATWSSKDVSVIFVLGGPGVGKGTQCSNMVKDYGFVHLSAGDLLRAEQERPGSEFGDLIKGYIKDGKIVPKEVTIALLQNAMRDEMKESGKSKFLIDGFPRQMDQAVKFEETVCESKFTLFFDADEKVMMERLTERGKTSGRADDNPESIKKRFKTFKDTSYPVIEYYEGKGKVVKVDAAKGKDEVYGEVKQELKDRLNV